jgi:F-box/leucine-rich repeat protein 9
MTYSQMIPVHQSGFNRFFRSQVNIKHLDLSNSLGVTDLAIIEIVKCLPELETLKLEKCASLTDHGAKQLAKLKHLRVLNISYCERLRNDGLLNLTSAEKRLKVRELYIAGLKNLTGTILVNISMNFDNLRVLDLSDCMYCADDTSIQFVFKYLTKLKKLRLGCCTKLSDAGITGVDLKIKPVDNTSWELEQTYSIKNLKDLECVEMPVQFKVTDFSLQHGFDLPKLREFALTHAHGVSMNRLK